MVEWSFVWVYTQEWYNWVLIQIDSQFLRNWVRLKLEAKPLLSSQNLSHHIFRFYSLNGQSLPMSVFYCYFYFPNAHNLTVVYICPFYLSGLRLLGKPGQILPSEYIRPSGCMSNPCWLKEDLEKSLLCSTLWLMTEFICLKLKFISPWHLAVCL